jgi:hypothetical protein
VVDVKTYKCFPTSIHEVKMDISTFDQKNMLIYIKNGTKDDDLHTMSYFRPLSEKIIDTSKTILKNGGYEFEKVEITNMWGNLLSEGNSHPPHTHSNNVLSGVYYLQSSNLETHQIGITLVCCSLTLLWILHSSFHLGLCIGFHPLRMNA